MYKIISGTAIVCYIPQNKWRSGIYNFPPAGSMGVRKPNLIVHPVFASLPTLLRNDLLFP